MRKPAALLAAILGVALLSGAYAQSVQPTLGPSPAPIAAPASGAAPVAPITGEAAQPLTADNVNAWLDGYMPISIGKNDIPGAVVVVVKDGQILTSRGYGFADVAKRKPVDPHTTLFRPGSTSKLFTWTAVMQQVEQGKLNLDADVNTYLDFKIPPRNGKPITLRNIMTHTSGFEEQVMDLIALDQKKYVPYDQILKRWVPKRVYDPGTTPAYSNWATALAGYIVSRVSGEPFETYIERHVFAPAGMKLATFRQPLPANLKPYMAEGYQPGEDKPYGYEFVGVAPAGSLAASGDDMGRFMIAHLANPSPLLKPETKALMHTTANDPIPGLQKMSLGFYQTDINGHRVDSHGGDTVAFHSDLHLFLNDGVGLFVSFNSVGKEGAAHALRNTLLEEFADRYFPAPADATHKLDAKEARANAEKLAGTWSTSRRSFSSFVGITDLISQTRVGVGEDGTPVVSDALFNGLNGQPRKWVAVGPMLWKDADSHEMLGAKVVDGRAVRFSLGSVAPIIVWDRTPWYQNSSWLLPLLYLSLAVLLLTIVFWPVRAIVRKRYGGTLGLEGRELKAYRASRIGAVAILGTLVAWAVAISMMFSDLNLLSKAFLPVVIVLQLLAIVCFIGGAIAMLWYASTVWKRAGGWKATWKAKLWSLLLVVSALTVLYVGVIYKLVAFATNY
ncbi:serine hydrolase domain-containing protein [Sphingomonas hankyongi]|uniref:Beta-lactamase family protein n=1 Tax=Sphingomonas hankyongi TaxID=2908209 RepID=A0ABT0S3J5_9SPHN|nr:serine hydrolase domain-containing protein [Sphingomonas hankyongi]MCL6730198.1 beta-lactamase family protein [Sphingomonas hankyongi]